MLFINRIYHSFSLKLHIIHWKLCIECDILILEFHSFHFPLGIFEIQKGGIFQISRLDKGFQEASKEEGSDHPNQDKK